MEVSLGYLSNHKLTPGTIAKTNKPGEALANSVDTPSETGRSIVFDSDGKCNRHSPASGTSRETCHFQR